MNYFDTVFINFGAKLMTKSHAKDGIKCYFLVKKRFFWPKIRHIWGYFDPEKVISTMICELLITLRKLMFSKCFLSSFRLLNLRLFTNIVICLGKIINPWKIKSEILNFIFQSNWQIYENVESVVVRGQKLQLKTLWKLLFSEGTKKCFTAFIFEKCECRCGWK